MIASVGTPQVSQSVSTNIGDKVVAWADQFVGIRIMTLAVIAAG